MYSYTEKKIITIKDRDIARNFRIQQVKNLKKNSYWVIDQREDGVIYRNDTTRKLSGIGDTSHKVLRDAYCIKAQRKSVAMMMHHYLLTTERQKILSNQQCWRHQEGC